MTVTELYDTCGTCGGVLRPSDPAPAGSYACECAERDSEEGETEENRRENI